MDLEFVPLLQIQRDLYRMPRDMEGFRAYLRTMKGTSSDDLELPLVPTSSATGSKNARCTPVLAADDLAYTRDVITPLLDATDRATAMACLFGDAAATALGYRPHGLSHRAGLALALHQASTASRGSKGSKGAKGA